VRKPDRPLDKLDPPLRPDTAVVGVPQGNGSGEAEYENEVVRYFAPSAYRVPSADRHILEGTLDTLLERVQDLDPGRVTPEDKLHILEAMRAVVAAGAKVTAPVVFPHDSEIEVRLVPANVVESLVEQYSDQNLNLAFFGIFAGSLLATVGALVFLPPEISVPPGAWMLLGAMLAMTLYLGIQLKRTHDRIKKLQAKRFRTFGP
jgi:hypothetical protein